MYILSVVIFPPLQSKQVVRPVVVAFSEMILQSENSSHGFSVHGVREAGALRAASGEERDSAPGMRIGKRSAGPQGLRSGHCFVPLSREVTCPQRGQLVRIVRKAGPQAQEH